VYNCTTASIVSLTTTTHVTAATEHLDINASDDTTFDNDIDENDLVMSVAQNAKNELL
jgi:hypothetical protein